uniref:J domain-containing protein n=1 Tax=Parastrongyloides trichosuri TaxID=131310 RepID=A0A0N5A083_PARTI
MIGRPHCGCATTSFRRASAPGCSTLTGSRCPTPTGRARRLRLPACAPCAASSGRADAGGRRRQRHPGRPAPGPDAVRPGRPGGEPAGVPGAAPVRGPAGHAAVGGGGSGTSATRPRHLAARPGRPQGRDRRPGPRAGIDDRHPVDADGRHRTLRRRCVARNQEPADVDPFGAGDPASGQDRGAARAPDQSAARALYGSDRKCPRHGPRRAAGSGVPQPDRQRPLVQPRARRGARQPVALQRDGDPEHLQPARSARPRLGQIRQAGLGIRIRDSGHARRGERGRPLDHGPVDAGGGDRLRRGGEGRGARRPGGRGRPYRSCGANTAGFPSARQRRRSAASRPDKGCPVPGCGPGRADPWRCATPRSGPRPPETAAPRPAPSRRRRRSFENLHQTALITILDALRPVVPILKVEDVKQEHAGRVLILHPDRARGAGDDHRQNRQAIAITHLQRNVNKARDAFVARRVQTQYDQRHLPVGTDDVARDDHGETQQSKARLAKNRQEQAGRQQARNGHALGGADNDRRLSVVIARPQRRHAQPRQTNQRAQRGQGQGRDHSVPSPAAETRQGLHHGQFADEARQRRQAGDHQGRDQEGSAQSRHRRGNDQTRLIALFVVKGIEIFIVEDGAARAGAQVLASVQHLGQHEKGAAGQGRADQIENRPPQDVGVTGPDRRQHRARRDDDGVGRRDRQVARRDHACRAEADGRQPAQQDPQLAKPGRVAAVGREQQEAETDDHIGADLGQDGEDGRRRRAGRRIGGGQPEAERPHGAFGQEGHAQHGRPDVEQAPVRRGDLGDAHSQISHVEGAGHAVDQADPDQEQHGSRQVDGDIGQPGANPRLARTMQGQAVGSRQHDLEEDEEVEQVAGQEGPVDAHDQQQEQGVETRPGPVPSRQGEDH